MKRVFVILTYLIVLNYVWKYIYEFWQRWYWGFFLQPQPPHTRQKIWTKNMAPKLPNLSCFGAFWVIFCQDVCFALHVGGRGSLAYFWGMASFLFWGMSSIFCCSLCKCSSQVPPRAVKCPKQMCSNGWLCGPMWAKALKEEIVLYHPGRNYYRTIPWNNYICNICAIFF